MIDLHSFAGAYALNSLNDADRARFEDHLETCGSCRAEMPGFFATASRLAEVTAVRAPDAVRARVLATVASTPQIRPVVAELERHRRLRRVLPRLVVAAVFALGAVSAGGFAIERGHARDSLVTSESISAVLAAPDASTKARAFSGGGNVRLVSSSARDVAVIVANDLPKLKKGSVYQVWMIEGLSARSQGTFATDGTMIMHDLKRADHVAVTVEPRGGSKEPTSAAVISLAI
ncbi:anti-sigma factor [Aeromicrobium sp.]|uniref:anti-sigma factor n=1 Tax=Aeromicrobium sp. TaxID=1871063 RepID=UPI003C58DF39